MTTIRTVAEMDPIERQYARAMHALDCGDQGWGHEPPVEVDHELEAHEPFDSDGAIGWPPILRALREYGLSLGSNEPARGDSARMTLRSELESVQALVAFDQEYVMSARDPGESMARSTHATLLMARSLTLSALVNLEHLEERIASESRLRLDRAEDRAALLEGIHGIHTAGPIDWSLAAAQFAEEAVRSGYFASVRLYPAHGPDDAQPDPVVDVWRGADVQSGS